MTYFGNGLMENINLTSVRALGSIEHTQMAKLVRSFCNYRGLHSLDHEWNLPSVGCITHVQVLNNPILPFLDTYYIPYMYRDEYKDEMRKANLSCKKSNVSM